jgi:hypothetical protein
MKKVVIATVLLATNVLLMACGDSRLGSPVSPSRPNPARSLELFGTRSLSSADQTAQLTAIYHDGGSSQDVTLTATWSVDSPGIATVSASGLVTAKTTGIATITARYQGRSATLTVSVDLPRLDIAGNWMFHVTAAPVCRPLFQQYPQQALDRRWAVSISQTNMRFDNVRLHVNNAVGVTARILAGDYVGDLRGDRLEFRGSTLFDVISVFGREYDYMLIAPIEGTATPNVIRGTAKGSIWYEDAHCNDTEHSFELLRQ